MAHHLFSFLTLSLSLISRDRKKAAKLDQPKAAPKRKKAVRKGKLTEAEEKELEKNRLRMRELRAKQSASKREEINAARMERWGISFNITIALQE